MKPEFDIIQKLSEEKLAELFDSDEYWFISCGPKYMFLGDSSCDKFLIASMKVDFFSWDDAIGSFPYPITEEQWIPIRDFLEAQK